MEKNEELFNNCTASIIRILKAFKVSNPCLENVKDELEVMKMMFKESEANNDR